MIEIERERLEIYDENVKLKRELRLMQDANAKYSMMMKEIAERQVGVEMRHQQDIETLQKQLTEASALAQSYQARAAAAPQDHPEAAAEVELAPESSTYTGAEWWPNSWDTRGDSWHWEGWASSAAEWTPPEPKASIASIAIKLVRFVEDDWTEQKDCAQVKEWIMEQYYLPDFPKILGFNVSRLKDLVFFLILVQGFCGILLWAVCIVSRQFISNMSKISDYVFNISHTCNIFRTTSSTGPFWMLHSNPWICNWGKK